jgi:hypothetical protein
MQAWISPQQAASARKNGNHHARVWLSDRSSHSAIERRAVMGFGKGALLWLLGIPLPIILLLALFWR